MRDKTYPVRSMRLSDNTWKQLNKRRRLLGLSWNRYLETVAGVADKEALKSRFIAKATALFDTPAIRKEAEKLFETKWRETY